MDSKTKTTSFRLTGNIGQKPGSIRFTCNRCHVYEEFMSKPPRHEPGEGEMQESVRFGIFKNRWVMLQVGDHSPVFICRICTSVIKGFVRLLKNIPGLEGQEGAFSDIFEELFGNKKEKKAAAAAASMLPQAPDQPTLPAPKTGPTPSRALPPPSNPKK